MTLSDEVISLLMRAFDKSQSGEINAADFTELFNCISHWIQTFQGFSRERPGVMTRMELGRALVSFGYSFPQQLVDAIEHRFREPSLYGITLDQFIRIGIMLRKLTDNFKRYDASSRGFAQLGYYDFIGIVFQSI